jgi:hypothetical protein
MKLADRLINNYNLEGLKEVKTSPDEVWFTTESKTKDVIAVMLRFGADIMGMRGNLVSIKVNGKRVNLECS